MEQAFNVRIKIGGDFTPMSHYATEKLAGFIENLDYSEFSPEVIAAAKASLLDFIGVAIAGAREPRLNKMLMDALVQFDGSGDSIILGENNRASAVHAALINATSGHSLDLDDGHRQALGHPGVCVVPAVLALGESVGSSGRLPPKTWHCIWWAGWAAAVPTTNHWNLAARHFFPWIWTTG
jgi:2-methylcitrate dehydratase PrpD